jgi:Integral membrane protein DUF92
MRSNYLFLLFRIICCTPTVSAFTSQKISSTLLLHHRNQKYVGRQNHSPRKTIQLEYYYNNDKSRCTIRKRCNLRKDTSVHLLPDGLIQSVFQYGGNVPLSQAFAINTILFGLASPKLLSALTPSGLIHSLFLGTMLWTTLGWRGWSLCVLYLILGQLVTKVKFAEKKKLGIAESRGGRRGPENVW